MKSAAITRMGIALAALLVLESPRAFAQADIDPDHFEGPNVEPFDHAKPAVSAQTAAVHFDVKSRLANNAAQNDGKPRFPYQEILLIPVTRSK